MPSPTSKKPAPPAVPPAHATPSSPEADLVTLAQRLEGDKAKASALALATYRRTVNAFATRGTIAPEEEQPIADALAFFGLTTDDLKRDTNTVKNIATLKARLGATPEERTARNDQLWAKAKASATALDRLRDALKKAEEEHYVTVGESDGFGYSAAELNRLMIVNPRLFAATWPLPPKVEAPMRVIWPSNEKYTPPPPPPTEVSHGLLGKMVPVTPEQYAALQKPVPYPNVSPAGQDAFSKRKAAEKAASAEAAEAETRLEKQNAISKQFAERRQALAEKCATAVEVPTPAE